MHRHPFGPSVVEARAGRPLALFVGGPGRFGPARRLLPARAPDGPAPRRGHQPLRPRAEPARCTDALHPALDPLHSVVPFGQIERRRLALGVVEGLALDRRPLLDPGDRARSGRGHYGVRDRPGAFGRLVGVLRLDRLDQRPERLPRRLVALCQQPLGEPDLLDARELPLDLVALLRAEARVAYRGPYQRLDRRPRHPGGRPAALACRLLGPARARPEALSRRLRDAARLVRAWNAALVRPELDQRLVLQRAPALAPSVDHPARAGALVRPVARERAHRGHRRRRLRLVLDAELSGARCRALGVLARTLGEHDVGAPVPGVVVLLGLVDRGPPPHSRRSELGLAPRLRDALHLRDRERVVELEREPPLHDGLARGVGADAGRQRRRLARLVAPLHRPRLGVVVEPPPRGEREDLAVALARTGRDPDRLALEGPRIGTAREPVELREVARSDRVRLRLGLLAQVADRGTLHVVRCVRRHRD